MSTCFAHSAEPARPFPQHTEYAADTIAPTLAREKLDAAVAQMYDAWKARYFHPGCTPGQAYIAYNLEGKADRKDAISCSEGHGYGMLLTAFMAGHDLKAQESFDQLFAWYQAHPSKITPGLMAWQQVEGCQDVKGDNNSASDGDLDIAYALLLADRQWGSAGAIDYRAAAMKTISAIRVGDVNASAATIKLGDWEKTAPGVDDIRLSDFMPDHFRAFARATGDPLWNKLVEKGYQCVEFLQTQHATGLLPDFARNAANGQPTPASKKFLESKHDGQYYYNACRTPWRLGVDAILNGDPRARAAAVRLNSFITKATLGDPSAIRAGYAIDTGEPIDRDDTSLAFTAPFCVSAMCEPSRQVWLDKLLAHVLQTNGDDDDYYGRTVCLLSLIVASGNWWRP